MGVVTMATSRCAQLVVAVFFLAQATAAEDNGYANDEVALPDVISMMQMKAGAGVKLAQQLDQGSGDVLVNGKLFIKESVRSGESLMVDKQIMSTGSIKSDDIIDAKVAFKTSGTITAKDAITSERRSIRGAPST